MIDLHIHTVYSDGEYLPEEITEMVVKEGIDTYAITDHDTILGAKEIRLREGILYIPGVELTARTSMGREHILGYDIDLENSHLNQVLQEKKRIDQQNFLLSYECLISLFSITFPKEELDALLKKPGNIGRVDLAILLKKYGHTKTTDEAFEHYLNPIYEKTRSQKKGMSESECIHLIKDANGYVSLAHPISLHPEYSHDLSFAYRDLKERLQKMKEMGLDAIEVCHIHQNAAFREMLHTLARELHLLESGGTDFHGEHIKPGVKLGTGLDGNIAIKELSLVEEIKQRRKNVL